MLLLAGTLAGCSGDGTSAPGPPSRWHPDEGFAGAQFMVQVDTRAGSVRTNASPRKPGTSDIAPSFSILGTDAITLTVSNYTAEPTGGFGSNKIRIAFDVSITNRLPGIAFVPLGVAAAPGDLMLFPVVSVAGTGNEILVSRDDGTVLTGADILTGVAPSRDWNGNGPEQADMWFDFSTNTPCASPSSTCTRWEAFPPVAGGATSPSRRVGFNIEEGVTYFQAYFMLLAGLTGGPAPVDSFPPPPPPPTSGVPFGPFAVRDGDWFQPNTDVFTSNVSGYTANDILRRLEVARFRGLKLILAMTGGAHSQYLTDGVFDFAKWKARMDTYDTPAIKQGIAAAVASGAVVGNMVIGEPNNDGGPGNEGNSWGPKGTMTKAKVDEMCRYVKTMFPTLSVGVAHDHDAFERENSYVVCEFLLSQYRHGKGPIAAFRDEALALGRRDGIAIGFGLNILNGGIKNWVTGECPTPITGGNGTYGTNCRMTAQQVQEWGLTLGTAGCALTLWRYDEEFMAKADNQHAFRVVAEQLAALPGRRCSGH